MSGETEMDQIKVFITDDHAILREGLISLIERQSDITTVGEASDANECLKKLNMLNPDVVLMDIKMTEIDGIDTCREIKTAHPGIKVIMLSMYDDFEYVHRALQAGADGYLLKKVVSSELIDAIHKVVKGEPAFSLQVLGTMVDSIKSSTTTQRKTSPLQQLSSRELEVLRLIGDGLHNKQIAAQLYISIKTVEKMLSDIYRKLGVNSRAAAVKAYFDTESR